MTLQSMTGFARSDGALDGTTWHWELRSVNNRGLDLRLRLPQGYEQIESKVRDRIAKAISRGSVNASLSVTRRTQAGEVRVNQEALERILAIATRLSHNIGAETPRVEALLGLKGVLDVVEDADTEETLAAQQAAVLDDLDKALADLVAARRDEGRRLKDVLARQIDEIERLAKTVEASPPAPSKPFAAASPSRSPASWRQGRGSIPRGFIRRLSCWRRAPTWRRS